MTSEEILQILHGQANPTNVAGMARFGINSEGTLGISVPVLRLLAKQCGPSHEVAAELWSSGVHEARIMAALIDRPKWVTVEQMENWVSDFDSWDVCDQVCGNLFDCTPYTLEKAMEWARREEEFVKRAGFVLMAYVAVHDKKAPDETLLRFLPEIRLGATDKRNFVKKAVNWALRQIGKRNAALMKAATALAEELASSEDASARWVGKDALREFEKKLELVAGKMVTKPAVTKPATP